MMTSNAVRTIDRIIDSFPASQQAQVRSSLADALRGIISQRLIKRADQPGMVAAVEVLLGSIPIIGELFKSRKFQRDKSEFLIFVTPRLVRPGSIGKERIEKMKKEFQRIEEEIKPRLSD
jgi:hypothetical protein